MKAKTIKSLETIIGRLIHLNAVIPGNQLQEAIREVAHIRDRVQSGDIKPAKRK
jgi:hypothetical protein